MARSFVSALFAATLFLPGCMPVFYAYPTLSCTLPTSVGPNHDHVYAFRVDVADVRGTGGQAGPGRYSLCQLHITPEGQVTSQSKVAVDHGYVVKGVFEFERHVCNTVQVRFYRAGYRLVTLKPWRLGLKVEWQEAADSAEREEAVDALLGATDEAAARPVQYLGFAHLQPGSASREHRQALLFAAGEYERLAQSITLEPDRRETLQSKGKALRELADH